MDLIDKSLCFRHEKVLSEEVMNMRIGEMPEISSSHWSHGNNGFLESLGRFVSREVPARLVSRGFAARHAALAVQLHCLKVGLNEYIHHHMGGGRNLKVPSSLAVDWNEVTNLSAALD
eukprot:GHVL01002292.1.p1 GENE.GHVL01002292.1~~GHVL01002292.1.p1  ORF type:complete len:118 (+),score=22.36 GHVL01002292.1:128-481(+)